MSAVWIVLLPLAAAVAGLFGERPRAVWAAVLLSCVAAALMIGVGVAGMAGVTVQSTLPIGLPWLQLGLRVDPLGGFFLLVLGLSSLAVSLYGMGYQRHHGGVLVRTALPVFVTGMAGVILAADAYGFMIFWELMSVSSYFLVIAEHDQEANRRAGFVYLFMAHLAGLFIFGAFAVLYGVSGHFDFAGMRAVSVEDGAATAVFLLAALGFGLKAGVVPLHVWLPAAHPVAPSHASALMSGVMIKVAVFGFLRVVLDLLGLDAAAPWWGALVLATGSLTAVFGVLMALQQHDLKRLLAYHSVENIGIIAIGIGLSLVFAQSGHGALAAVALVAALFHVLNHALFKGLLFMGAGAVLTATGTRELEAMGGLIRRMPQTAALFLVGCVAIAALPPLNGFVSEWLTFQAALMAPRLEGSSLTALLPVSAALLALAGALSAACFVKVFGVAFLGQPRSEVVGKAEEVDGWMRWGMAVPAFACLLLGLFPGPLMGALGRVSEGLLGAGLPEAAVSGWTWIAPLAPERASYSPGVVALLLAAIALVGWALLRHRAGVQRVPLWSCGHPRVTPDMQYTATAFSQPLRQIFSVLYRPREQLRFVGAAPWFVRGVRYSLQVSDRVWQALFLPVGAMFDRMARRVEALHARSLHFHLGLVLTTLLVLLGWVSW